MKFHKATIPLKTIDTVRREFCWSFPQPPSLALTRSMKELGILQPLWMRNITQNRYQLVSGWRRLRAAQHLRIAQLPALILPTDTPLAQAYGISLLDNLSCRPLHTIEIGRFLSRAARHLEHSTILKQFFPLLDLKPSPQLLEFYLNLGQLPLALQMFLYEDKLVASEALSLSSLDPQERQMLLKLFSELSFTFAERRQLLSFLRELSIRTETPITQLLELPELKEIVKDPSLAGKEKVQRVLQCLRRMRYPTLSRTEDLFANTVAELPLKGHMQIKPPAFFEGSDYILSLSFRNAQQLQQRLQELSKHRELITQRLEEFWKQFEG